MTLRVISKLDSTGPTGRWSCAKILPAIIRREIEIETTK
jgi:hypothetical protein